MTSTSTSVTTIGGVMIVTQVIPKNDSSIALQAPPTAAPEAPPPPVYIPPTPTKMDKKAAIFLRGEPQGLGVVQIFIGLLGVLFSLTVAYSPALVRYAPFGLAALFVVSGALAVAAGRRTSVGLVWASLLSNGLSVLLGLAGVAYLCFLLASGPPAGALCSSYPSLDLAGRWWQQCLDKMERLSNILYGLLGLLLVLFVLQVGVAIGVCVFSGKVIRRFRSYSPIEVEADDVTTLLKEPDGDGNNRP